ncbi:ion channel protein [Arthrobacter agilis]|uniref:ion channel protein n=1 Tax=Arthrobacter agilis TaxID=37921 RepID=UPI0027868507|nr:ion channel protein [Arthrobacter agilis]MDQ0734484.1 H+/Cl- antiporter ClcA [Arthrobacter agilis]
MATDTSHEAPPLRTHLTLCIPAILVGAVSAVGLYAVEELAHAVEHLLWETLPAAWKIDPASGWWIFGVLTLAGVVIGLVVQFAPGHGGTDSATTELIAPPLRLSAVPSLLAVTVLGLAGGVSLGPEIPIIAFNTAILVALVARLWPGIGTELVVIITAAGTIGALFGTPVAAALVFTGVVAGFKGGGALWDRLFIPLVAAGAGTITMRWLDGPQLPEAGFSQLGTPGAADLVAGLGVTIAATLIGLAAVYVFPHAHRFFHGLRNPAVYIALGGAVLGVLGVLGGPVTLFKGASQMGELIRNQGDYSAADLVFIIAVKLAALVVAAAAGFRGGRIFPAVFIGTAAGLVACAIFPTIPLGLALGCGILGVVLPVARDGWIALFIAVVVVGDAGVLPVLCIAILPAWLLVSRAPEMLIHAPSPTAAKGSPVGP